MSDIVTRLRNWREVHLARLHLLMEEAADEMERLCQVLSQKNHCPDPEKAPNEDSYLAEIDRLKATITSLSGDRDLFKNLARQFGEDATRAKKRIEELGAGPRLTDEEREAVAWAASCASDREHPAEATLRGLLERLK
jgi:hypothetical protein